MLHNAIVRMGFLRKPLTKDKGATAVEYAFMVFLIAAVIVTSVALVGTDLDAIFDAVPPGLAP